LLGRSPKLVTRAVGSILLIQDQELSRQHFEIVLTNDRVYLLKDLNSLNGTCVDGIRRETAVLVGGCEITAGKTTFIFTGT
jgi:pSer/pThr/pTyr-binding forkhead associated (FHA) protein